MQDILKELHLESVIPHFLAEQIEPANMAALLDEELCRVGVTTKSSLIFFTPRPA